MKLKASIAASLIGLVAGVGCSSGSDSSTSAGAVAPAKWSTESKAGVRQLMAMAAQGPELDCAVDVVTSIYSPEDWTYVLAHPTADGQELPARMQELEDRSARELEEKCGIKDTRAEDKAKADAMDAWNAAVDEWNKLTEKRDAADAETVVVNGRSFEDYKTWAAANGKPIEPPQ